MTTRKKPEERTSKRSWNLPIQKMFKEYYARNGGDLEDACRFFDIDKENLSEWLDPEGKSPRFLRDLERYRLKFVDDIRQEYIRRGLGKRDADGTQMDKEVSNDVLKILGKIHVPEYKEIETETNATKFVVLPAAMPMETLEKMARPVKTVEHKEEGQK